MNTKICKKCNIEKELNQYRIQKSNGKQTVNIPINKY